MRKKFNLDATGPEEIKHILIFGPYGSGKTHLQGDFCRYYIEQGKTARFLNLSGEDGYQSLKGMGLGDIGESVDSLEDYEAALVDYRKDSTYALAIDSLTVLYRLLLKKVVGEIRYPDAKVDGQRAMAMWGQISMGILNYVHKSRSAAEYTLWVAPYDKNTDPVTGGETPLITPNLPGQNALACYGWFDMVGYLSSRQGSGPGKAIRSLTFVDDGKVQTRQRLPQPLGTLQIPEGGGGWAKLRVAIEQTFKGGK